MERGGVVTQRRRCDTEASVGQGGAYIGRSAPPAAHQKSPAGRRTSQSLGMIISGGGGFFAPGGGGSSFIPPATGTRILASVAGSTNVTALAVGGPRALAALAAACRGEGTASASSGLAHLWGSERASTARACMRMRMRGQSGEGRARERGGCDGVEESEGG